MTPSSAEQQWSNLSLLRMSGYGFGMIGFDLAMATIILPVLVQEVAPEEWKNTYLAVLGFSGLMVAAMIQPLVGQRSDRTSSPLGRRTPYMLWGGIFVCLGLIGLGFAPNYATLFAVWLFMQANFNIGYGPYQALIRDLVPLSRVGVASSLKILSDATGALFLIAISSRLIGRGTGSANDFWVWMSLGMIAVTIIVATTVTTFTVRAKEVAADLSQRAAGQVQRPARGLHPQLSRFLLSRLLIMTAITAYPTFGLFFLEDAVELENPTQALGDMVLVVGGALALSIYPAGWVSDRIGRKPVVMAGAIGAAAASIWLREAHDVTSVLVTASLLGASIGVLLSSNWALANELGTKGREALHMGVVNLATTGGSAAAKMLGPGIDLLNRTSAGSGYDALLITCSILFVLGAAILMPLKVASSGEPYSAGSPEEAG